MRGESDRALILRGLGRLESSGIDPASAAAIVAEGAPPAARERCRQLARRLAAGDDLAGAAKNLGLLTDPETEAVRAAANLGSPAATLTALADHLDRRAAMRRHIRSRLMLPLAVLLLAVVIAPLPAYVAGRTGAGGYGLAVVSSVAPWLAGWVLWRLAGRGSAGRLADKMTQWPLIGAVVTDYARRQMLSFLGLALDAGLDAQRALPLAARTVANRRLRSRYGATLADVQGGKTVSETLQARGVLDAAGFALVSSGEAAGKLAEMIRLCASRLDESITRREQLFAEWVPRVVYTFVVVWIAKNLLGL